MFRSIHLPKRINPEKVRAEFRNGILKVTAEVAADSRGKNTTLDAA
jgi:HSP20 family molecular chaperone IbpA